jgi:hypothetical protein
VVMRWGGSARRDREPQPDTDKALATPEVKRKGTVMSRALVTSSVGGVNR